MPNIKSAIRKVRRIKKQSLVNKSRKSKYKQALKKMLKLIEKKDKNKTKILDGAFIGSNSSLVAPIKIGKNSVVGAGSALTKNVKNKSLSLTRSNQIEIKNYKRK